MRRTKKMKRMLILCAVLVAGALSAVPAFGHAGAPYRTAQQAADSLVANDIEWDSGIDTVTYASCRGTGAHYGIRYRHFRCYVETEEDDPYWVLVHTGWSEDSIAFLYYD
jgi:hypothetical protein